MTTPKRAEYSSNRLKKATAILGAWHNYCMESWIFRILVKLGLRK